MPCQTALRKRRFFCSWRGVPLVLIAFGLAACSSERPHRGPSGETGPGDQGHEPPIPRMEAQGTFFDGQILVEALLARAGVKWSRTDAGDSGSTGGDGGRGGSRGGMHMGGGGGRRGGHGGGRGGGGGEAGEGGSAGTQAPPIHAINQAPIVLRLRLTNHGAAPAAIAVIDFDSSLGDFAVQPESITVNPGDAVEAEPMVSRLGVTTTEIPVTVKLRTGDRTEQQVITLHVVPTAAPAPPGTGAPPEAPGPPAPAAGPTPAPS